MANEKISQFAIDADIEDIDGLAAMTITNAGTANPAGGVPIEYGNVALPGYAFTLGNILKTKENRSDPDPANWADVASNVIPATGTTPVTASEGIMWKKSSGEDLVQMVVEGAGSTLKFKNQYTLGQIRHGIMFEENSIFTVNQAGNNSTISLNNTRTSAGDAVRIQSGQDTATDDIGLLVNARGEGSKLKLFSGKDIIITSGKGASGQQAGDVIVTLGTSSAPTANQVLAAKDTSGTLEWQDKTVNTNTEYAFNTTIPAGSSNVQLDLNTDPAGAQPVGTLLFEHGNGIVLDDNVVTGSEGSFSIDLNMVKDQGGNFAGGLDFDSNGALKIRLAAFSGLAISAGSAGGLKLSAATANALGGISIGYTQNNKKYPVELDTNKAFVEVPWTDTPVTLDTSNYDYLSLSGQQIELEAINLAEHVTGTLPIANGGTGATNASDARDELGVDPAGTDNSTPVTLAGTPDYITISGQTITRSQIDLTSDVTGVLPVNNGGTIPKAFQSLLSSGGVVTNWVIKDGYNAKIDFTNGTSVTAYDFTTNAITSADGDYGTLIVINDSTAGTITFPANSYWVGGNTPTATDDGIDIYSFVKCGSDYYWTYGLDNKA